MATTKVNVYCSNSGSHYKQNVCYKWSVEDNCMIPYFGEKFDLYNQIQLAKSQVDLDMIIKRAKAGDPSVLHVRNEVYADVSEMPDNLNDLHQLSDNILSNFNSLDPNIRNLFGNDISRFSQAVADGSFSDTINNYLVSLNKPKDDVKSEKKVEGDK